MSTFYLESASYDPAFNLALEQYVFDCLPRESSYLMLWQNQNAVIVGKYQNTVEEINADYVREHGIKVVRRLSGGGAVFHDLGNLNFTFITDVGDQEAIDFGVFCRPVIKALAKLGVAAELSGRNDITIQGQKISGNSQYIRNGRVMHHGTLLFNADLGAVSNALKVSADKIESKGVQSVRARVTNIRDHLTQDIGMPEFINLLRQYLAQGEDVTQYHLTEQDLEQITALRRSRYDTWEWNYGASPAYRIRKERRVENCGKIEVYMEVSEGKIAAFATRGDYFGNGDPAQLSNALIGVSLREKDLLCALGSLDVGCFFNNLTAHQLADIILL